MAEWKWVDSWELGYEYECPNCGCHIDTKRKGEGLPKWCPICKSEMEVKEK